jgi:hypothetical protein
MRDDKKKFSLVPVDPATHSILVGIANQEGVPPNELLGHIADTKFISWEIPDSSKPLERARWLSFKSRIRARCRDEVYRCAVSYLEHPTEKGAEDLAEQCDLVGLDYTQVIKEIKSDPFSSMVEFSRNGSKTGECIRWLAGEMLERKHISAKLVFALGQKKGFNQTVVNAAKRAINADIKSPMIKSVRTSTGWDWAIEEKVDRT